MHHNRGCIRPANPGQCSCDSQLQRAWRRWGFRPPRLRLFPWPLARPLARRLLSARAGAIPPESVTPGVRSLVTWHGPFPRGPGGPTWRALQERRNAPKNSMIPWRGPNTPFRPGGAFKGYPLPWEGVRAKRLGRPSPWQQPLSRNCHIAVIQRKNVH